MESEKVRILVHSPYEILKVSPQTFEKEETIVFETNYNVEDARCALVLKESLIV